MFSTKFMTTLGAVVLAGSAQAAVITSLPSGSPLVIPSTNQLGFAGPATIAPGVTYSSTQPSAYGYTGNYGFNGNGNWSGTPMIGLDRPSGYFEINFAAPISAFLAETNWTNLNYAGDATVEIFDAANTLLETLVLENNGTNLVAPGFWGFSRSTAEIATIRFSNEYVGIREVTTLTDVNSAVPESATWMMMVAGFGLAGGAIRYRRGKTVLSFG
jgi:hypothetical protein